MGEMTGILGDVPLDVARAARDIAGCSQMELSAVESSQKRDIWDYEEVLAIWLGRVLRALAVAVVTLVLGKTQGYHEVPIWPVAISSGILALGGRFIWPFGLAAPIFFLALNIVPPELLKVIVEIVKG